MEKLFQILVVLDYALVEPWNKSQQSTSRYIVRAIPEMAVVPRGSQVQWLVRNFWPLQYRELLWAFHFRNRCPFRNFDGNFHISTTQEPMSPENANHQGSTEPLIAEDEGEFKYDIRVTDAESKQVISDEDPVLFVR